MRWKSYQNIPTFTKNLAKYGIRQDKLTSMMLEHFFSTQNRLLYMIHVAIKKMMSSK